MLFSSLAVALLAAAPAFGVVVATSGDVVATNNSSGADNSGDVDDAQAVNEPEKN